MDKSNWSLIFERPNRREKKRKRKRREEEREIKKVWIIVRFGMELCIDLHGYMFVGCGL